MKPDCQSDRSVPNAQLLSLARLGLTAAARLLPLSARKRTYRGCSASSQDDPKLRSKRPIKEVLEQGRDAVHQCLKDAGARLPRDLDRQELAALVLSVMEGAVMQARTYRDVAPFDGAVRQLRGHFARLMREASPRRRRRPHTPQRKKKERS